jgi:hypothetical protein
VTRDVSALPFPARLAIAREMLDRPTRTPPTWMVDQLGAAVGGTRTFHERVGALLPVLEPERNWRPLVTDPTAEVTAYLTAAVLGCPGRLCCHLRRGGPQPALAHLPLRRVDCLRCAGTIRRPPPEDADRCDVCGRHGVTTFTPIVASRGPVTIGDACSDCARALLGEVAA